MPWVIDPLWSNVPSTHLAAPLDVVASLEPGDRLFWSGTLEVLVGTQWDRMLLEQ